MKPIFDDSLLSKKPLYFLPGDDIPKTQSHS
jgi:hypothetical protein